jgi:arsenate reductase
MAAALFNLLANPALARAVSAGTVPGDRVHPEVAKTMAELGVELSTVRPRLLTDALAGSAQILVTMGCEEDCPIVPGVRRMDWPLPDPKGRPLEEVRKIRDEIRSRVLALLTENGWQRP